MAKMLFFEDVRLNAKYRWNNSPRSKVDSIGYKEMAKLLKDCNMKTYMEAMPIA